MGQQKRVAKITNTKYTNTNKSPLEPGSSSSRGRRGQGATTHIPLPFPPAHSNTFPRRPLPPGQDEHGEPRGNCAGERETQGEVTEEGRPRSPKMVQSAEGGTGKDKRERSIVVVRSPCQENYPADAHTNVHKSVLESANSAWTWSVNLDAPGQWHRQQPASGTADPEVVKQDKSSRVSVDTTKTHLDPQRVGM